MKKVESAKNSIRARENSIYLDHAKEGGLSRLQDVDDDELLKAIQKLPNKQCASDPIPTCLLIDISERILPFVKSIVNQSFFEGIFPKSWKSTQITPLLKKSLVLITTLLHPTDHSLICLFCPSSHKGLLSTES